MSYRQYLIQPHTDLHNKAHMNNEATLSNFYLSRMHVNEEFFLYRSFSEDSTVLKTFSVALLTMLRGLVTRLGSIGQVLQDYIVYDHICHRESKYNSTYA